MKTIHNILGHHTHQVAFALSCIAGLTLGSCAEDLVNGGENGGDNDAAVTFNVSSAQDDAQAAAAKAMPGLPVTRAAFAGQLALQNLTPEDLTMQKLPVQGAAASNDLCLIETTVPGVPSQLEAEASTRANITKLTTMQNFSTTAFYGSSDTSLAPWFYDKDTKKDGTLVTPIYWNWLKNHARFYAVYPKPYSKLVLSPESYTGTPYVNFEVEPDVKTQKDLMTACSGVVHYATQFVAPTTNLKFRHALTAVRFKVGQNLSYSKTITKVEIIGAKSKGRYTLSADETGAGATWSNLSDPKTFTLGGDGTVSVSTSTAVNNIIMGKDGDNYVFYMIPQPLAGVSVNIYFNNAATPSISIPLTGTWKPGTTKTYALSQNTSTWQYELTVTPPAAAEYNATSTGNYKIESYRKDPATNTLQKVAWKVVGYSTDGGLTWSDNKPAWFTGLTKENGEGSTNSSGETGTATLQPELIDKLAQMNAALKQDPQGDASDYYDLSLHDVKGNLTARSTANCYIISHPGYYKIPLVYGNAITNGNTNTDAYQTSNTGTYILTHFKDHDNKDITDPWITQTNGGVNAPDGAKLVWADESGLVTNLAVANDFVQFEVPAANIKNGNAVIAVTKGGTVVWSWHLWFIHDDALNTTACTNHQGYVYKFTAENLGTKYTTWKGTSYTSPRSIQVKVVQTNGQGSPMVPKESILTITQNSSNTRQGITTLYQWGRKDAFPGTDAIADGSFIKNAGNNMSITNGIQHPENFYTWGSSWQSAPPTGYTYDNLWSANNTSRTYNDNPVVKTIYDPCPAGFKLPASNAFNGFTKFGNNTGGSSEFNISDTWDHGWHFNNKLTNPDASVYFPASGYRDYTIGLLGDVGVAGYHWSAIPAGSGYGIYLDFRKEFVKTQYYNYSSYAFAVRPVAE